MANDILARAVRGEQDAFADLVRQHQRMVFSVVWNFFSDRALAEDVAQEVFLQLFQNLHAIESDSHLLFWLRRVAIRKCIDHHRWRLLIPPLPRRGGEGRLFRLGAG